MLDIIATLIIMSQYHIKQNTGGIMKATLKLTMPGFTGRMKDVDVTYDPNLNMYTARRRKASPGHVPDSSDITAAFAFARRIVLSEAFLEDCHKYIKAYNVRYRKENKRLSAWSAIWMKMMKAQIKAMPGLDLSTITREECIASKIPCRSLSTAVEAGFLVSVPGHQKLINHI